jgi:peptidoglycan/LPS O-acetylase OafA/YrhL
MTNDGLQTIPAKGRDMRFDILKTLGLLCIILAHSNPPKIIFQARNFDVPLMVIVSGTLFYYSFRNKQYSFIDYLKKRIPRLVAPVWLFFTFFFSSSYLLYAIFGKSYPFSFRQILETFLLLKGIGYVWIIRVFIIMAIISPLILRFYKYLNSEIRFFSILSLAYVCYEVILHITKNFQISVNIINLFIKNYLLFIVTYGYLLGIGIILTQTHRRLVVAISLLFLMIFSNLALYNFSIAGNFVQTQMYKNQPRIYYLSYAIFISTIAYLVIDRIWTKHYTYLRSKFSFLIKWIEFVSSSSLWIYLWHIYLLFLWNRIFQRFSPVTKKFLVTFIIVTIISIAITFLQKKIFTKIIANTRFGQNNSEVITTLFLK